MIEIPRFVNEILRAGQGTARPEPPLCKAEAGGAFLGRDKTPEVPIYPTSLRPCPGCAAAASHLEKRLARAGLIAVVDTRGPDMVQAGLRFIPGPFIPL